MSASPICSAVAGVAGTIVVVVVVGGVPGDGVLLSGWDSGDWPRTTHGAHTMAAISVNAGSERSSNLRIFPPQEGIGATNLLHRHVKLEHPFVYHRQVSSRHGCKAD